MYKVEMEHLTKLGFLTPIDHPVVSLVEDLKRARRGNTFDMVDGECDGPEWYHPAVLRQIVLASERGVKIRIIAGPTILTEPQVKADLLGEIGMLKKVRRWLIPLIRKGFMTAQWATDDERGKHLKVISFRSTIYPLASMVLCGKQNGNTGSQAD